MCGIAGILLPAPDGKVGGGGRQYPLHYAQNALLDILARQEYRGYDSAGIAAAGNDTIRRAAVKGRVETLKSKVQKKPVASNAIAAIAHTRWATHGAPSEKNAHPIVGGGGNVANVATVAIAHNGIIENHAILRAKLEKGGIKFHTDTDSEVIAHLFAAALIKSGNNTKVNNKTSGGGGMLTAMRAVVGQLHGAFAIAALCAGERAIVCARRGSPLLIGEGGGVFYASSDAPALAGKAARLSYLIDGDCALIQNGKVQITDADNKSTKRKWQKPGERNQSADRGNYKHFMKKEIDEQPQAAAAAMERFVRGDSLPLAEFGRGAAAAFGKCRSVGIVACGTSYHAAMIARYWIEKLARVPCRADIASEYRYRIDPQARGGLMVAVSQSGETADTLAAAAAAKQNGAELMAIVNETQSSLADAAKWVMPMRAGLEIGVASTKAFTAQLAALLLLALALAKAKKRITPQEEKKMITAMRRLPLLLRESLSAEGTMRQWARAMAKSRGVLFVGRRAHYPLALEGALKLKEISYLHAEGCAAGELKHGTLALVDDKMPVVALTSGDAKMAANIAEIAARKGNLHILCGHPPAGDSLTNAGSLTTDGGAFPPKARVAHINDDGGEYLSPLVLAPPLQLLAYHTALIKGADIDKPRNLAKSVTVE